MADKKTATTSKKTVAKKKPATKKNTKKTAIKKTVEVKKSTVKKDSSSKKVKIVKKSANKKEVAKKTVVNKASSATKVNSSKKVLVKKEEFNKTKPDSKIVIDESKLKSPVSLTEMLEAGVHFGHQSRRWNPKMAPYIWKNKEGVHIFDLLKTAKNLALVCEILRQEAKNGKNIVFIGTKRQASEIVKKYAEASDSPYVVSRWAGGTLTNWNQVRKSIDRLNKIRTGLKNNEFSHYTKKERVLLEREAIRLERLFGGLVNLKSIPDILFIVDTVREKTAIKEANICNVPVYAIADTNSDPDDLTELIPANDDAVRSIEIIVKAISDAIIEGKKAGNKNGEIKK